MDLNNIAVIYGSDSSEWEVSVRSGEFTASQIDGERFNVYEIFARFGKWVVKAYRLKGQERVLISEEERPDVCKTDFSAVVGGEKVKFDYAYIMQHGTPGENGLMQGYLEMIGVPHSGCNAFVSAITSTDSPSSGSSAKASPSQLRLSSKLPGASNVSTL